MHTQKNDGVTSHKTPLPLGLSRKREKKKGKGEGKGREGKKEKENKRRETISCCGSQKKKIQIRLSIFSVL